MLGYHTERMAAAGVVALGFTNAPASIAPWGAASRRSAPIPGRSPFPTAAGGARFVIDQSASVVAKSEVMKRARAGEPIPPRVGVRRRGQPTTDPARRLTGTMAPAGGYKGVGAALMVEVFAACLAGANPGVVASPFSGTAGGPPGTGSSSSPSRPVPLPAASSPIAWRSSSPLSAPRPTAVCLATNAAPRGCSNERDGVDVGEAAHATLMKLAGVA